MQTPQVCPVGTYLRVHPLRNFWNKKLTGSCQLTELWRHEGMKVSQILREMADYCTFEGNIVIPS